MLKLAVLVVMALLPAVLLCVYIFVKDRVEKEPVGLLLKLLLFGAISCIPVALVEGIFSDVIDGAFAQTVAGIASGNPEKTLSYYMYYVVDNFIGIALVEEVGKLAVVLWLTRKNKEFNSLFDGIIYCTFASLGFAALENVLYVLSNGFTVAIMRAVLAVPGHMFYGVLMGYHYSMWHISDRIAATERALKANKLISAASVECSSKASAVKCLLIPVLAHGLYDFCCFIGSAAAVLFLLAFVACMYVHCFRKIRNISKVDRLENDYIKYFIIKKYPHLSDAQ